MGVHSTRQAALKCVRAVVTFLTTDLLAAMSGGKSAPQTVARETHEAAMHPLAFVLKRIFRALLRLLGVATALFTLTGLLGRFWWAFDITSHFRAQYLAGALVLAGGQSLRRRWRGVGFALSLAAVNVAVLAPHTGIFPSAPVATASTAGNAPIIRAVLLNVHTESRAFERVRKFLRDSHPDFAVLEEIDATWERELEQLQDVFPFTIAESREDNFGILLLSRHPLTSARIVAFGDAEVPSVVVHLTIGTTTLTVVGTHPLPPAGREYSLHRNQQLAELAKFLNQQSGLKVLLGDLNTTPWNYYFQQLVTATGLRDSAAGRGYQGSWPDRPFFLRISLDQCLLSPELRVVRRSIGPDVGSDHFPVIVDFAAGP